MQAGYLVRLMMIENISAGNLDALLQMQYTQVHCNLGMYVICASVLLLAPFWYILRVNMHDCWLHKINELFLIRLWTLLTSITVIFGGIVLQDLYNLLYICNRSISFGCESAYTLFDQTMSNINQFIWLWIAEIVLLTCVVCLAGRDLVIRKG